MSTLQCWPAGKFLNRKKPVKREPKKAQTRELLKPQKQCSRYLTILEEMRARRKRLSK